MKRIGIYLIVFILSCEKSPEYSSDYISKNTGALSFEIPEVLELAEIAISLTKYEDKNRRTHYWTEVNKYFGTYKSHPLINELNNIVISTNVDYDIRMGAFAHKFDDNGKIVKGFYPFSKFGDGENRFNKLLSQFEDFSIKSNFRQFYKSNKDEYDQMIKKQIELMPVREMWDWLEKRFDDKSQSYKIIFSPLFGGNHNTVWYKNNNFRESIFFVSYIGENFQQYNQKVKEGLASRIVFTEIDHNYVNPTTEKYTGTIKEAFCDVEKWNSGKDYQSPILTFNEYMTWAVFTIYCYEKYDLDDFEEINRITEDFIVKNRGFKKFKEFNFNLLNEFRINKEMKSDEMYKIVLDWALKS